MLWIFWHKRSQACTVKLNFIYTVKLNVYVPVTVLGTRNTLMKRPDVVPTLMELTLELRRETKLKVATLYQKKKKLQWTNA